ncbi:hypothetical protein BT69DRAFT_1324005 [Atractiella rhizophila]|nr:hypothetical protein BT69DRAFT_1324005 [Atractiella rhizophila]
MSTMDSIDDLFQEFAAATSKTSIPASFTIVASNCGAISADYDIESTEVTGTFLAEWDGGTAVIHKGIAVDEQLVETLDKAEKRHTQRDDIGHIVKNNGIICISWNTRAVVRTTDNQSFLILSIRFTINPAQQKFKSATLTLHLHPPSNATPKFKVLEATSWHSKGTEITVHLETNKQKELEIGLQDVLTKLGTGKFGRSKMEVYDTVDTEGVRTSVFQHGRAILTNAGSSLKDGRGLVGGYETIMILGEEAVGKELEFGIQFKATATLWKVPLVGKHIFQTWTLKDPKEFKVFYGTNELRTSDVAVMNRDSKAAKSYQVVIGICEIQVLKCQELLLSLHNKTVLSVQFGWEGSLGQEWGHCFAGETLCRGNQLQQNWLSGSKQDVTGANQLPLTLQQCQASRSKPDASALRFSKSGIAGASRTSLKPTRLARSEPQICQFSYMFHLLSSTLCGSVIPLVYIDQRVVEVTLEYSLRFISTTGLSLLQTHRPSATAHSVSPNKIPDMKLASKCKHEPGHQDISRVTLTSEGRGSK